MLHSLAGRPLVLHALGVAAEVTGRRPLVVVSPDQPEVTDAVASQADTVEQPHPRGTGDALRSIPTGQRQHQGPLLVLSGDVPLLRAATLQSLLDHHQATGAAATLLTITPHDPKGLGRILRDPQTGRITTAPSKPSKRRTPWRRWASTTASSSPGRPPRSAAGRWNPSCWRA